MESTRRKKLTDIIRLSRDMLDTARELEWDKVAILEVRRKQCVMEYFRQPVPEQEAAEVAAAIKEILDLNQQVTELGKQCSKDLGTEIHANNRGRAATSAYLSHAR